MAEPSPSQDAAPDAAADAPLDAAADAAPDVDSSANATISEEEVSALLEKAAPDTVQPFDLSSRRVSRTQLPMLEILSRDFAFRAGMALSELLSRDAGMVYESLQSAKAAELLNGVTAPAALAVIRIKPLNGFGYVNIEPALLLALLDGFFGGAGRAPADTQAAAAPAAQRFLALVLRSLGTALAPAWAPVIAVEMELVKLETNPRFVQPGEPQDMFLVMKFTVTFGDVSGQVSFMLPETLIAPLREAFASDGSKPAARKQQPWAPVLCEILQRAEIEARAILAEVRISLGELVRLVPGDIIPIDAPQHATLLAGEVALYRGRFGVSKGQNALKIVSRGAA
jgi:flagellar motor switch protein FliM